MYCIADRITSAGLEGRHVESVVLQCLRREPAQRRKCPLLEGCCAACHQRYCNGAGHQLDAKKARDAEGIRLLAAVRGDIALRDDPAVSDEPLRPAAAD